MFHDIAITKSLKNVKLVLDRLENNQFKSNNKNQKKNNDIVLTTKTATTESPKGDNVSVNFPIKIRELEEKHKVKNLAQNATPSG